ncbi:MAG: hypothetical protein IJR85_10935 [Synergistaceae bacterium]|nr:hypothetical protein [Synergistaceae bacterium]
MRKFLALMLVLCACQAYAHGTGYRHSGLKAVALEFFYSDGEKMSYREARVFSPRDEKFAVQTGRTDEEGRFAFVPDCPGEWRVIVRDEEGHQCTASVGVRDEGLGARGEGLARKDDARPEMLIRAILGVSLLFNIAMIVRVKHNAHK